MIALIGKRYTEKLGNPLKRQGFSVIPVPENPNIDPRISGHVDLSIFIIQKTAVLAGYLRKSPNIANILTSKGYQVFYAQAQKSAVYPGDAVLCAKSIGGTVIHSSKISDHAIKGLCKEFIDVRQGYAACSTLAVDAHSLITADVGIAAAAASHGFDVLQIQPGYIDLQGYDTGFIGGASFQGNDKIYFTGKLDTHPDKDRIIRFINEKQKTVVFLTDEPIFDVGGAIILQEDLFS